MHTFELSCYISTSSYSYLHDNLPKLRKVSKFVERTNYYSEKGITQIELRTYQYPRHSTTGVLWKDYYLVIRCNPSIIVGDSKILLIDLEKYSPNEIVFKIMKRIYEINEFRYIKLNKLPIVWFSTNRVDIAEDVLVDTPQLVVWLCNMSFPYGYRKMKRKKINKDMDQLYCESCVFHNASRTINIYYKLIELINNGREIQIGEYEKIRKTVRFEVQIKKQGIYNLKLPTRRLIMPFLEKSFCRKFIRKEVRAIFGIEKYVSRSKAIELIQNSSYKLYDKAVMLSIIDMINRFNGLYELEKAIVDKKVYTTLPYGNIRTFKNKWLKKFKKLGIQPVVIPDSMGIEEMPSIFDLFT